jgi:hypothetical protein
MMRRPTADPGSRPEVLAGFYFQQMAYGEVLGDFILAGRAQRQLEQLGWLIRRMEPPGRGDDRVTGIMSPGCPAEAGTDEHAEADAAERDTPADHPLGVAEVRRLVGATERELDEAIESGRFPLPDGHVSLRPYWQRDTIAWWVERGTAF